MTKKRLWQRIPFYLMSFLVMTLGISISIKSRMGVSPISSIPYAVTCIWGIEMGTATILFHITCVLIQWAILRKNFKPISFLQIVVAVLFGKSTTLFNFAMDAIPDPQSIVARLTMTVVSCALIAFGLFLRVPSRLVPLAGEGVMHAMSKVSGRPFSTSKIVFDVLCVVLSGAACMLMIGKLGSVGIGTGISAVLVGLILKVYNHLWQKRYTAFLWRDVPENERG